MFDKFKPKDIVVFFGKTGVGKTSTINALFNLDWETDNAKACTSELKFEVHNNESDNQLLVVDTPGIAESEMADKTFFEMYVDALSNCGHLIWIFQGDTRVYRPDQIAFKKLNQYFRNDLKITMLLNQIDLIGEADWNKDKNEPSANQFEYIEEKKNDILEKFQKFIPRLTLNDVNVHSVKYKYNTQNLYKSILKR